MQATARHDVVNASSSDQMPRHHHQQHRHQPHQLVAWALLPLALHAVTPSRGELPDGCSHEQQSAAIWVAGLLDNIQTTKELQFLIHRGTALIVTL